jgi:tRNA pseudouridine55 synthase
MARKHKRPTAHGWLLLDKPQGLTSNQALGRVKFLLKCKKAGHAGTLDPLATGCLPIAFGEATKTVPFVVDDEKHYRFTVTWGAETDTDDTEGAVTATSDLRPTVTDIEAALPAFIGEIEQVPPQYSAIKIDGNRAYDLAREGQSVEIAPRVVQVFELSLIEATGDTATFDCHCGKGTYVRSIARDLGRALGCLGHVSALRRVSVGDFEEQDLVTMADLEAAAEQDDGSIRSYLHPVEIGLETLSRVDVNSSDAMRLRRGQSILLRGAEVPVAGTLYYVMSGGGLVALAEAEKGALHPRRVFDLSTAPVPA